MINDQIKMIQHDESYCTMIRDATVSITAISSDFTLYEQSKFTQTANVYDTLPAKAILKATERTQTVLYILLAPTSIS